MTNDADRQPKRLSDVDPTDTLFDPANDAEAAPQDRGADANLERRLDEQADKLGNYVLARASLGLPPEGEDSEVSEDDTPRRHHLSGRPLTYPRRGNIRDFHDGGRADEHRGGFGAPELGSEADDTLRRKLPELMARRDKIVEDNIRNDFEEDVIASGYEKIEQSRSRALSRLRGHIQRHYPEIDQSEVTDYIADYAETLLAPSPNLRSIDE